MFSFNSTGSFDNTKSFLEGLLKGNIYSDFDKYGRKGVEALARATPRDTGKTAGSWQYRIIRNSGRTAIEWYNTNENNGVNIAVILQYGHGTGTGGYVVGRDYINPAIKPIFEEIEADFVRRLNSDK
jgi:hypothetical protein